MQCAGKHVKCCDFACCCSVGLRQSACHDRHLVTVCSEWGIFLNGGRIEDLDLFSLT